jgi:hypothetical protein
MRWYVSKAGETTGPIEEAAIRVMAKADGLRGAQVRDENAGAWIAAEKSPFGSLMKERSVVGPIVAGLAVMIFARLFLGWFLVQTEGDAVYSNFATGAWVLAAIVGLLGFGLLYGLRRI